MTWTIVDKELINLRHLESELLLPLPLSLCIYAWIARSIYVFHGLLCLRLPWLVPSMSTMLVPCLCFLWLVCCACALFVLCLHFLYIISITIISWSEWPKLLLIKNWQISDVWSQYCYRRRCSLSISMPELSALSVSSMVGSVCVFCDLLCWRLLCLCFIRIFCCLFADAVPCLFLICIFYDLSSIFCHVYIFCGLSAMPVPCLRLL